MGGDDESALPGPAAPMPAAAAAPAAVAPRRGVRWVPLAGALLTVVGVAAVVLLVVPALHRNVARNSRHDTLHNNIAEFFMPKEVHPEENITDQEAALIALVAVLLAWWLFWWCFGAEIETLFSYSDVAWGGTVFVARGAWAGMTYAVYKVLRGVWAALVVSVVVLALVVVIGRGRTGIT